jgi:hypothetical protein
VAVLVSIGIGSNIVKCSSIDFTFIVQNIFRFILTGLIGYWTAKIFKYSEQIKENKSVNILKKIQKKDKKWIFSKINDFAGGDLYHLEYQCVDKIEEIEIFLRRNKFELYFCNGSKDMMKDAEMKINETRIEMNTKFPNRIEVEYFDGIGKFYSRLYIQK